MVEKASRKGRMTMIANMKMQKSVAKVQGLAT